MQNFFKGFSERTLNRRNIAFTLLFGIVSAIIGPLGTFTTMGFWDRLSLWCVSGGLALLVIGLFSQLVATNLPTTTRVKHGLLVGLGFSIVFPLLIASLAQAGIWSKDAQLLGYLEIKLVIAGIVVMLVVTLWLVDQDVSVAVAPRLYARLNDIGSSRVVRLTVSDHYTEVFTSDGETHRLLMRFADAVSEMDDVDGFLTHRSHWVMRREIKSTTRIGAREFLILQDGSQVPISKTYRPAVVSAGVL